MRALIVLTLSLAVTCLAPSIASAALGELSLVSRADGVDGALGDGNSSTEPRAVSADGRYVTFTSYADNIGGPFPTDRQVYRRDLLLGRTELVSRATGVNGAVADDNSITASISADGSKVAFVSGADNLSPSDNNAYTNVFVRDLTAGTTALVSRASGPAGAAAVGGSLLPVISGDGTAVAFQSAAANLDPTVTDDNAQIDAFVRDLLTGTTRLVSKSTGGTLGNGLSTVGDISGDGRFVAIETEATTLGGAIGAGASTVYIHDRQAGTTTLVSQPDGSTGVGAAGASGYASVTDGGNRIAFTSNATNLAGDHPSGSDQVYVRDVAAATTSLVSRAADGAPASADSEQPVISRDGSTLTFISDADNLDGPASPSRQGYVRDMASGRTQLISRSGAAGPPADQSLSSISIGADRYVAFTTNAANLVAGADGTKYQAFIRDVRVPDPVPTPAATIAGRKFVARLSKRKFKLRATTTGGATAIRGTATIRVPRRIVNSGKVVVKLKSVTVPGARTSHQLAFKLSKTQNRRVLKALKSRKSRVRISVSLTATGPGGSGGAKISGKLKR